MKRSRVVGAGVVIAMICGVLLTKAHSVTSSITVSNQSSKAISHVYLSAPDSDNWGPDQLGDNGIAPGAAFTISNPSCDGSSVKVIAEDADGCFLTSVVQCSGEQSWTITNSTGANCGN